MRKLLRLLQLRPQLWCDTITSHQSHLLLSQNVTEDNMTDATWHNMSPCQVCQLGNWEERERRERGREQALEKVLLIRVPILEGVVSFLRKVQLPQKPKHQGYLEEKNPNRLGTNQCNWTLQRLLKSTRGLGRPSVVKEGTHQSQ